MTNMATPNHKNPCPGGNDIHNYFVDHYYSRGAGAVGYSDGPASGRFGVRFQSRQT